MSPFRELPAADAMRPRPQSKPQERARRLMQEKIKHWQAQEKIRRDLESTSAVSADKKALQEKIISLARANMPLASYVLGVVPQINRYLAAERTATAQTIKNKITQVAEIINDLTEIDPHDPEISLWLEELHALQRRQQNALNKNAPA